MSSLFWSDDPLQQEKRELEIVQTGKIYEEFEDSHKADLEAYLSARNANEALRGTSTVEALYGTGSDDERIQYSLNAEHEMRILELHPGVFDASLKFETHVCSVEFEYPTRPTKYGTLIRKTHHAISQSTGRPIWYTALSYVWGSSALLRPATCNGKPFKITLNLDTALRHLRRTDTSVMLWIDQICINQQDLNEKTQQVLLMGKIYQHAWNTLVWLGEEADNSGDAIDTIRQIGDALQYYTDERVPDLDHFERLALPVPGAIKWLYLNKLLSRPWFRRVWVFQEVAVSTHVQLQCGRRSFSWDEMSMFASCMISHDLTQYLASADINNADQSSKVACIQIRTINDMNVYLKIHGKSQLLNALVDARRMQATDLRDKVFGIMEMTETTVNPDYSKAVFEIYMEATEKCIPHYIFSVFCCVDHEQPLIGSHSPSWVPNWGVPRQTTSLGYSRNRAGVYRAAEDSRPKFEQLGGSLSVIGILFDTILNIVLSADSCLKDLPDPTSSTAHFVIQSMRMAIEHCQPYPSHSGLFPAFWQTLVAGKDESGFRKSPPDYADIFALLLDSATGTSPSLPDQPVAARRLTLANLRIRRPSRIYRQMQVAFEVAVKYRGFGITLKRYMGIFPRGTRPGDQICVFLGGHVPFVLRRRGTTSTRSTFQLIGECYLYGIMDGEVMQMTNLKREEIRLV